MVKSIMVKFSEGQQGYRKRQEQAKKYRLSLPIQLKTQKKNFFPCPLREGKQLPKREEKILLIYQQYIKWHNNIVIRVKYFKFGNRQYLNLKMKMTEHHKHTPKKQLNNSNKKKYMDDALGKQLMSPMAESMSCMLQSYTPIQKQPEFLLSPSPVKKDLFSQLLANQPNHSPLKYNPRSILEEDGSFFQEDMSEESSLMDAEENEENCSDNEGNWSDQNGIKKRKRKSTTQIKLLKQELDGEMNWTKEKIVRMAQITGLSQSQVYKWCWDQKKKQVKSKDDSKHYLQRRKIIRKDLHYRNKCQKYDEDYSDMEEKQLSSYNHFQTKLKSSARLEQNANISTEKKVKKRLVFS